jgi:uncharacterized protein with HEPN domain
MVARPLLRLRHIKDSIRDIRDLLEGKSEAEIVEDRHARLALERLFEIISEASRHIPQEWRASLGGNVPWPKIAGVGNILRHAYDRVELSILWTVYENDLAPLEAAVDAMLTAHAPKEGSS